MRKSLGKYARQIWPFLVVVLGMAFTAIWICAMAYAIITLIEMLT